MNTDHLSMDEYRSFINEITKLQFVHLWYWLKGHPDESFPQALRGRMDLARKTDPAPLHFDICGNPEFHRSPWSDLEADLQACFEQARHDSTPAGFEQAAFARVKGILSSFAEKTYGSTAKSKEYQCGSLKYDKPMDDDPKAVMFHIANAVAPKSIFFQPGYLEQCFLDLMDRTEEEYGADALKTISWLNAYPRWLAYFPQEWMENMSPDDTDVRFHLGFWGQFISARGTLDEKTAEMLRETGRLPYYLRSSRCSFAVMRKHLSQRLSIATVVSS